MMKYTPTRQLRRGVVVPLVGLLLIPLLAMMAFSIDIGYAVQVRAELVNTADAAALSGVQQLYSPYLQWRTASSTSQASIQSNAITCAKATVTAVANSNKAGRSNVGIVDADVDVGYTNGSGTYYSGNAGNIPANTFPNTVVVTARRDNTSLPKSNGELPLFFGPVLGKSTLPLTASATAVAYEGTILSFNSISGTNGGLMPVAEDMSQWTDFYKNGGSSAYADPNAPAGSSWLQIYPGGTGASMDGLLSLNGSKAASETYYGGSNAWIQTGATPADITSLKSSADLPLPSSGTGETWASGPGMKSTLLSDFQDLITTPPTVRYLPLFDPSSPGTTTGGNGTYQICYVVPVYLVYAQGDGKANMDIAVTPAPGKPISDPTVVVGNVVPMGTSANPQYTVPVAGKLTQ